MKMLEYTIKTEVGIDGRILHELLINHGESLLHWVVDTLEAAARKALISMGWTPPQDKGGKIIKR